MEEWGCVYTFENGMTDIDQRVRIAAFNWLDEQASVHGDVLPRSILARGFEFEGQRVPLVAPQGIFKPKLLPQMPLSITTAPEGPYDDSFGSDGLLLYRLSMELAGEAIDFRCAAYQM